MASPAAQPAQPAPRSHRPARLAIAGLAATTSVVLVLEADSSWHLVTSPWFAVSLATAAAILHLELDRG